MTEAEWLESNDPAEMGAALMRRKRASDRVLRLCMAAFWSWQSHRLKVVVERSCLHQRAEWVEEWADSGVVPRDANGRNNLVFYNLDARKGFLSTVRAPKRWANGGPAVARAVWVLREVFGNPFAIRRKRKGDACRGWIFEPAWRTDTVVMLARTIYESRDFTAMPILADALQDAGCNNADVLNHCRARPEGAPDELTGDSPAQIREHVRGCWVLDLVLDRV